MKTTACAVVFQLALFALLIGGDLTAEEYSPPNARAEVVAGVAFTEGPVWHPDGSIYFSDVANSRIMQVDPSGTLSVYRENTGRANGLVFDLQGRLIACEGGNRRVTRTELNGEITVLADQYLGKKFNSPNDVTVDSAGNVFFTDPRYGNRDGMEQIDDRGEPIEGVYRISNDGTVTRVLGKEIERPNGLAVSPDNEFLYVAVNTNDDQGKARELWRFTLQKSGSVIAGSGKKLFDWGTDRGPDGIALDQGGRIYATTGLNYAAPPYETAGKHRAGVYVISNQGKLLHTIPVPIDMITNCAFGGDDRKTLYITAGHKLWNVRVKHAGYTPWPPTK